MKSLSVIWYACLVLVSMWLGACTASSELGEESTDATATAESAAVAQPESTAVQPPPAAAAAQAKPSVPALSNRQGFTTKEDTIEAESEQRTHRTSEHASVTVQPHVMPSLPHTGFTVQVGAFKDEKNAERAVGLLARRYARQPAAKQYNESARLYRITIGDFATEKEALRFAAGLKKKFPREYSSAWVVRIAQ